MLDSKELRQLRQRISVRWSLSSLTADEVSEYVRHRLRIAAGGDCDLFNERALREIRRRSRGIPRLVNLLADRALLAGYATGAKKIGPGLVSQAAREILKTRGRRSSRRRLFRGAFGAAVLVAAIAAGAVVWRQIDIGALAGRAETAAARPPVSAPPPPAAARRAAGTEVGTPIDEAVAKPMRPGLGESG
jgi:general secretion pathway protein A